MRSTFGGKVWAAVAAVTLLGCAREAGEAVVVAEVERWLLEPGETVRVTARTVNGSDGAYTFASGNEERATVDPQSGEVTALSAGEVEITARGSDTRRAGSVQLVVRAEGTNPEELPNYLAWASSGHADQSAPAFNNWNEQGEIPVGCARCHSTPGYLDYLGADETAAGTVDTAAPIGTVVECRACHNPVAQTLSQVEYPSGAVVTLAGRSARCEVCHQGRESTVSVNTAIGDAAAEPDALAAGLGFRNIHFLPAGATLNGGQVQGGYQYEGRRYDVRFQHAAGLNTCASCHDPHSTQVRLPVCQGCHLEATSAEGLREIRMLPSRAVDFDGDGNLEEGIFHEVEGLKQRLLPAILAHAVANPATGPICYDSQAFPYWFIDDGDGSCSEAEAVAPNRYATWTPRLLRAAYNYHFVTKDAAGYAHNAKYQLQLLFDSLEDLDPAAVAGLGRNDVGHHNGSALPFRNWDAQGEVPATCSRCHGGAEGLAFFHRHNATTAVPAGTVNGLQCETCHEELQTFGLRQLERAVFPGPRVITNLSPDENLCANCHSGRESKATIDAAIAAGQLSFRNVHFLPAAGTLLGSEAQVGYEYEGRSYAGRWTHSGGTRCVLCHDAKTTQHSFLVSDNLAQCQGCHANISALEEIRLVSTADYDGDGNATEPLAGELEGLSQALLAALQANAAAGGNALCYADAFPYFFRQGEGGACEATQANRFTAWTPALMRAAHNYQFSQKDHGAWAHNFRYMTQLLIDSIEDLGGEVGGRVRN